MGYVVHNFWLRFNQPAIAGTMRHVPYPYSWDGALWTLFYEFLCYLLLGALALFGLLRRRPLFLVVAGAAWLVEILVTAIPALNIHFDNLHNWDASRMLSFVPVFLAGSVFYLYRDRVRDSGWIALACLAGMFLSYLIPVGNAVVVQTLTRSDISAVLLVYPVLWLGAHLPGRRIGSRNDYSYGVYIYAFPVAQLLALWGVYRWGYVPYTALTLVATFPLAMASWWVVERRALRMKRMRVPLIPARRDYVLAVNDIELNRGGDG